MKRKKILVISHNPFSKKQNNGKVLESFLYGINKKDIAQIYLHGNYIDYDFCDNYFKFSDVEVLKKIIFPKYIIKNDKKITNNYENDKNETRTIYNSLILWWFRSIVWQISKPWKYKELIEWVNSFKPDVILYQSSNFYSFFDFVLEIQKMTNAKLFTIASDDYLNCHNKLNILEYIKSKKMNQRFKKTLENSEAVFVVNEFMKVEYSKKFGTSNLLVWRNALKKPDNITKYVPNKQKVIFLYAGNILLDRWKNLVKLGKVLDLINEKEKMDCALRICTLNNLSFKIKNRFNKIKSIKFLGKLNKEELIKETNYSDILVHTESFDKKMINYTRLSLSTKISEYMMSKRCILMIGPDEVSSTKYIKKYKVGFVITNKDIKKWYKDILRLINDDKLKYKYIDNAIKVAHKNHDLESNIKKMQSNFYK